MIGMVGDADIRARDDVRFRFAEYRHLHFSESAEFSLQRRFAR